MDKNAVIYTRVSTDEQAEKGYSLSYQEERIRKFAEIKKINVVAHFVEDHSAKTFNRPEFTKLLSFVKANKQNIHYLIFLKWDRFSRNATDAMMMIREFSNMGIEMISVEQPLDLNIPENKFMLAFYLTAPEVENDRRASNTMAGMRRAMKEGRWMGNAPKGYCYAWVDGKAIISPDSNAGFIVEAYIDLAKGIYSVNEVRRKLYKMGFKCSQSQFYQLVRNRVYTGKIVIKAWRDEKEEIVEGLHEPILSDELFRRVQEQLNSKNKKQTKIGLSNGELPLRRHLICPKCGNNLTGSASINHLKNRYYYYHCQNGCKTRFPAPTADKAFMHYLNSLRVSKEVLGLYNCILSDYYSQTNNDISVKRAEIDREVKKLQTKIEKAEDKLIDGEIDNLTFERIKTRYSSQVDLLVNRDMTMRANHKDFTKQLSFGLSLLGNLPEYFMKAQSEIKQKIVSSIFPDKLIFDGKNYRTSRINEVLSLIFRNINGLGELQKERVAISSNSSCRVAPPGIEPESKV